MDEVAHDIDTNKVDQAGNRSIGYQIRHRKVGVSI